MGCSLWKPRHRLTALAMLISVVAMVPGSDNVTRPDDDFHRRLPEVLDLLCPYSKTCRGGEPRLQLDDGMESCCTECSCEDSCGLTESCCYPEQAAKRYYDRSFQQCEQASTRRGPGKVDRRFFYMVTRSHGNEAGEDCGTTCGENKTASVLGSLYPVSSKTTGLIYKNELCARCHGVARSDMTHWMVVMSCRLSPLGGMVKYLQSLETGRVHNGCVLDFYYPGPQYLAKVHRCYENTVRRCLKFEGRSYRVPSYLNMTDDEVRAACLTGPQAQYQQYYNLFCSLCVDRVYNPDVQCVNTYYNGRFNTNSFSALLGSTFLEKKSITKQPNMETRMQIACKRQNQTHIDVDDCRPVLCSSGKVRRGIACVFQTETLFYSVATVAVELYARDNRNIYPFVDHLTSNLHQGNDWRALISAPGLGSWRLSAMCYHDDTQQLIDRGLAGFFWLRLTLEQNSTSSFSELLASIDKFMTEDWNFLFNMTSVPLERKFSGIENALRYKKFYYLNPAVIPTASLLNWQTFNCTERTLKDPYNSISKLFFCDQIALQPDEYIMDTGSKALYVKATGRVLTPAEYSLGLDASGNPVPRLCLEDTGYVLVPQQSSASQSTSNWSLFVFVVIFKVV